jgi:hypothetical protein
MSLSRTVTKLVVIVGGHVRCSMTGLPMNDSSEGIYDDGEWISWDWISGQLEKQELRQEFPGASLEVVHIFHDLVSLAQSYKAATGRYLQIWGELGELYAEIKYGLRRHKPGHPGSDGRIGNDWIEVKTISPEKTTEFIHVKTDGNFNILLVVRIGLDFEFHAKMIPRALLGKGQGKRAKLKWEDAPDDNGA